MNLARWWHISPLTCKAQRAGHSVAAIKAGLSAKTASRVQWFTSVKAVVNTVLVQAGFKRPPRFKARPRCKLLMFVRLRNACPAGKAG